MGEKLINSKARVQKHGEVFTPSWMVEKMLNNEGIREACQNINATFLEPSAGSGNFLMAILREKLGIVVNSYSNDIVQYENFSLYALSTLYGIELLEDNVQICKINLFKVFEGYYSEISSKLDIKPKKRILDSARVIINSNISQGNFLTRKTLDNDHIVFSEWKLTEELNLKTKIITVSRTEYTLDEIFEGKTNESGQSAKGPIEQLEFFDFNSEFIEVDSRKEKCFRYANAKITEVYKEELVSNG